MLVEFALVLTPLLLIVFGFLQFGIAMNAKINSTHLTAEGARYIAVNTNPDYPGSMADFIRNRAGTAYLKTSAVEICYPENSQTGTQGEIGDPVRVRMSHVYPIVPLVGLALSPSQVELDVTSETTMRLEAVPTKIPPTVDPCPA